MKPHLAGAAAERLARATENGPMAEEEVLLVLARIARTGRPGDRLRAAELIGKHLGMFRDPGQPDSAMTFAGSSSSSTRSLQSSGAADAEAGEVVWAHRE